MDTTEYTLIVDGSASYVNINAQAIDSGAAVSGAGGVSLNVGSNDIVITVRAGNGSERSYRISITRRDDGSGGQASMPVPGIIGNTDSGGAAWANSGQTDSAAGPGVVTSSGSESGTDSSGYAVIGPGGSAEQAVIQNSTSDSGDGGAVLIGEGPQ
jgi:hypothetical protein